MGKSISSILVFLFVFFSAIALEPGDSTLKNINSIVEKYIQNSSLFPQEKVYMHFDNTAYYIGEKIWFKAYVVTAGENNYSPLSATLFVELVAPEGRVIETQKLKITDGQADGDFVLDRLLYSGFYEIRAYTRYMLNWDKESLFSRVFPVFEEVQKAGDYKMSIRQLPNSKRVPGGRDEFVQKQKVELSFFPEGGNLVSGLTSNVAIKAVGKSGENLILKGSIEDEKGNIITSLATSYQGMGSFNFTPQTDNYIAKVQYEGKDYTFKLPEILPKGYVMNVEHTDYNRVTVLIQKSQNLPVDTLGLTVSCRGKLYVADYVIFGNKDVTGFSISDKLLPSGVTQLTLFDQNGNILSERMVFINHQDQLIISVEQDKPEYKPYEKVNLDFQIKNSEGQPVKTSFSLTIRDKATSVYNPYRESALTSLLLSSELKGYIENPGYYFESNNQVRKKELDLLMLTQGWSRYICPRMVSLDKEYIHPIEKLLVIEGKVLSPKRRREPEAGVEVRMVMFLPDSTSQQGLCVTNSAGEFNFGLSDFCGNAKLTLTTKKDGKAKSNYIVLDRVFSPEFKNYNYAETQLQKIKYLSCDSQSEMLKTDTIGEFETEIPIEETEDNEFNYVPMEQKNHKIDEVKVTARKKYKKEGEGLRSATMVYNVQETVEEMIDQGMCEPVNIHAYLMKINPYFSYEAKIYKTKRVIYVLNNISTIKVPSAAEELNSLLMDEIGLITIDESPDVCQYLPYDWCLPVPQYDMMIVFVYTNEKYEQGRFKTVAGMRRTKYKGYTCSKEFYNPDYSYLPKENDFRRTLYWNPSIKTDSTGKASITFFNNGTCKRMDVNAETVTNNGKIGVIK